METDKNAVKTAKKEWKHSISPVHMFIRGNDIQQLGRIYDCSAKSNNLLKSI
jgi:hypothetical protein